MQASMTTNSPCYGMGKLGSSASDDVKEAWNQAAKETGYNGRAESFDGMLTQITELHGMSLVQGYLTGNQDVLGSTSESAKAAIEQALTKLGIPENDEERKEQLFYNSFLEHLSSSQRVKETEEEQESSESTKLV